MRNGVFIGTVEIYHPNGKLHSRTPMQNGKPEGVSQGYTKDGKLRTEILYQNGRAVHFKRFNAAGKIEAEGNL